MMITTTMTMVNTKTTSSPTWKLYENPFYTSPQIHNNNNQQNKQQEEQQDHNKQLHLLHLPVSTRKITASFWDLTFIKPFMDSELDTAKAQIMELKAQLEYERKARKKMEFLNKKLAKEVCGEKKEREAMEKVCEELAGELASSKSEISRLKMEMEEERKMLRVAEVLREERVQMKLSEAKFILEEKISELEIRKMTHKNNDQEQEEPENRNVISGNSMKLQGRKVSLEPENPHIKRGIRGFVEFPRVVRAIGSRSRHLGTKLECQKAQLMILLKQKTQIQSNNLIMS
ncbi:putative protein BRANCHLESS TRICHOME [Helianthus annuus]|uniref:Putative branchless trichome n=1 Tax=Helianthus annuus TaxID=4232 RepID=A0A251UAJ3_HELAN|nr:protein BRANCHLESS TRICHOME [Helianthus annuus]KAF5797738.1 putative protein BRANCHLESS TRICHOME [Helianthus annuus]KAJ0555796.1 putative protein BRANCHLESS TRICHOME [Helianthus annuus]KAJ0562383.1 putative protein BRANCHLESS TRICHOME [Helianthus annuus]KAJ0727758.1 putative protein BRANCHLESS TRICHOME [Helianthus annuus]KAJ0730557.1 putative protein BRANCHLESS TRICHOME [Helianthus annuus]